MGNLITRKKIHHGPPEEIVMDIFSYLPVRDLLRYKCACKKWNILFGDPHFIDLQMRRAPCNVIGTAKYRQDKFTPVNIFPTRRIHDIMSSTNGLLCVLTSTMSYAICNPATDKFLELPKPPCNRELLHLRLYRVSSTGKFKVISSFSCEESFRYFWYIYTVGEDSAWRIVEVPRRDGESIRWCHCHLTEKGAHWQREFENGNDLLMEISTLDLDSEQTITNIVPSYVESTGTGVKIQEWNGYHSYSRVKGREMRTWVLENYVNNTWRREAVVLPYILRKPNAFEIYVHFLRHGRIWFQKNDNHVFSLDIESKRVEKYNFKVREVTSIVPHVSTLETLEGMQ